MAARARDTPHPLDPLHLSRKIKIQKGFHIWKQSPIFELMALNKPIDIELLEDALKFFESLPIKIQKKLFVCFDKTKLGIKGN